MNNMISSFASIIDAHKCEKAHLIVAIDGRCASGKTTLAAELQKIYNCNVIHMDDFFLRPEQRTADRLESPGENIDHERFLSEVLIPLKQGKSFYYQAYDCHLQTLSEPKFVPKNPITLIEGSYSCHPSLWEHYDLRLFLSIDPNEQMKRIIQRDGEAYSQVFKTRWIPLEESYFSAFDIANRCDMCYTVNQNT